MSASTALDRLEHAPAAPLAVPGRRWLGALAIGLLGLGLVGGALLWRAWPATPGDGSAEAGFARDMSAHHEQAVEMAQIIVERTDDPLVRGLAMDIMLTQQGQIGQMMGWLDLWDLLPTSDEPLMAWMGHAAGGQMPGMATREELRHLESLSGVEADREFLRLMIRHHEGGAPMAQAILERTDLEAVRRLARSVIQSQQAEIDDMRAMLESKGDSAE